MSAPNPRFYTTEIPASRTANQIGEMIRKYGGSKYQVEWDEDGEPLAVRFAVRMPIRGEVVEVPVKLMAQTDAIHQRLTRNTWHPSHKKRALRCAWRQLHAYVEMSLELARNKVKPFHEIFMGDLLVGNDVRLVEAFEQAPESILQASEQKLLTGG